MILAFILAQWRWLLPLAGALALFIAFRVYVASEVRDARQSDAAAVLKADAKADDRAGVVAASEAATVEQGNTNARKAANAGDDPLKRGFDSLRARKTGHR